MASILDGSVSSDSEDDADYIPVGKIDAEQSSGSSTDELDASKPLTKNNYQKSKKNGRVPTESSGGNDSTDEEEAPKTKRLKKTPNTKQENKVMEPAAEPEVEVIDLTGDEVQQEQEDKKKHEDGTGKSFLTDVEATTNGSTSKPSTMTSADAMEEIRSSAILLPNESASKVEDQPTPSVVEFAGETFTVDGLTPAASLEKNVRQSRKKK